MYIQRYDNTCNNLLINKLGTNLQKKKITEIEVKRENIHIVDLDNKTCAQLRIFHSICSSVNVELKERHCFSPFFPVTPVKI